MISKPTEFTDLANGRYKGLWSGRKVVVSMPDGMTNEIYVRDGVHGINVPCKVTANDNDVTVETLDPSIT